MTNKIKLKMLKNELRDLLSNPKSAKPDDDTLYLLKRNIKKIQIKIETEKK